MFMNNLIQSGDLRLLNSNYYSINRKNSVRLIFGAFHKKQKGRDKKLKIKIAESLKMSFSHSVQVVYATSTDALPQESFATAQIGGYR
jgi:hypothetical protein